MVAATLLGSTVNSAVVKEPWVTTVAVVQIIEPAVRRSLVKYAQKIVSGFRFLYSGMHSLKPPRARKLPTEHFLDGKGPP